MRSETQPWDDIRITAEIVDDGTGVTGLTVECYVRRTLDGDYLQDGGGGWGASPDALAMTEVDSSNLPGLYGFTIQTDDLDPDNGHYIVRIVETTYSVREHLRIVQCLSAADARKLYHLRTLSKVIPTAWDATTKQPTAGSLFVYRTDAEYDADTTPDGTGSYAEFPMEANFTSGQMDYFGVKPA